MIIYRCGTPAELCEVNPDGTGQHQLTSDGGSAAYHGASLDLAGTRMVFTRDTEDLFAADGNAQNVVGPISRFGSVAKISFDGSTVVDEEDYTLVDGTFHICTFTTNGAPSRNCGGPGSFPAFTPDGQIVASVLDNGHDAVCVFVIASGGGGSCTRELAVDPSTDLDEAAVSPDGTKLAVVAIQPGGSDTGRRSHRALQHEHGPADRQPHERDDRRGAGVVAGRRADRVLP